MEGSKEYKVEVEPNDQTQEMKSLLTVMVGERPRPRLSEPAPGAELVATGDLLD